METVAIDATEDDDLVRAAAEGDRRAFGELYVRHARMVHGILLARVPREAAEDLLHDVFVAALERLGGLRSARAFRGWLLAIARNRATDYFRTNGGSEPLENTEARRGHGPGVEAFLILDQIRSLPEAYRETLILRLVEGMTGPEIARQTGLTPDSVRVNLCRGMKMLRRLLGSAEKK
ncbi:MAG TPA: sigma-70 family RNA polymerase sigma factor [Bryobacteraceae bacterium]|nr:sigma-70 family RNA polymerase sigma factor [Bryobacteraceae bacterium]